MPVDMKCAPCKENIVTIIKDIYLDLATGRAAGTMVPSSMHTDLTHNLDSEPYFSSFFFSFFKNFLNQFIIFL